MPDGFDVPKPKNTVFMHYSPEHAEMLGYFVDTLADEGTVGFFRP